MVYKSGSVTPYYHAIRDAVEQMYAEGKGAFHPSEIADRLNVKVTGSMRRALKQLEEDVVVQSYRYYTERGGLAKAYYITPMQSSFETEGQPF